ncbi:DUF948 domain-containing protein [Lentibacillus cibarius]|uniref:DUF948 domain-containing protein n=1 Tax=Lentibacillus cibarius TaxID=2583219 RepID=A0A549YH89_9BACI|nr:DUF948 domain-containing protein [Lentibacillus cibarius]TMN22416.1 DUF948 domain-containing protein [Lentibacillus cibarius]TRM11207.1 DUF948 domain-containing protein [Lentibacillus cibarius]
MSLTGIGVILIGAAFLVIAVYAAWTLNNLANLLRGMEKTVEKLPDQLDDLFRETGTALSQTNQTISEVNDKLHTLSPLFYMVRDVGEASRKLTSPLARFSASMSKKMERNEKQD